VIHEIGANINTVLKTRGCPILVIDGPEPTNTTTGARERIVLEHDEDAGDSYAAPQGTRGNDAARFVCQVGYKATFYVQAPAAGAKPYEHRRRAEHLRDLFTVAMFDVAKVRKNNCSIKGGRFIQPVDLAKSETIAGAVYELKFTFDRGIRVLTWAGEKRPEAAVGDFEVGSTTKVRLAHGADDATPETGCGG